MSGGGRWSDERIMDCVERCRLAVEQADRLGRTGGPWPTAAAEIVVALADREPYPSEGSEPFAVLKALPEWQAFVAAFSLPATEFVSAALSRGEALMAVIEATS